MEPRSFYCANCQKHTEHVNIPNTYATRCTACNCQTSHLERLHVQDLHYTAPDGTEATVVENRPGRVVFYVPSGEHAGYYHYQKGTGKMEIVKGLPA